MKKHIFFLALAAVGCGAFAAEPADSVALENITVTGVRSAADIRQLPFTVTTISKEVPSYKGLVIRSGRQVVVR